MADGTIPAPRVAGPPQSTVDLPDVTLRPRRRPRRADVAGQVRALLGTIALGRLARLPVALRFWDGSVLPGDRDDGAPAPTVTVSRRAVGHLLHEPNQLGLTRAFVAG